VSGRKTIKRGALILAPEILLAIKLELL